MQNKMLSWALAKLHFLQRNQIGGYIVSSANNIKTKGMVIGDYK